MATVIGTPGDLYDLLRKPGDTPDAYAQFMRDHGVTGDMRSTTSCLLANWVKAETGAHVVAVDHTWIDVWFDAADGLPYTKISVGLPDGASDLAVAFDRREYPDLIAGTSS